MRQSGLVLQLAGVALIVAATGFWFITGHQSVMLGGAALVLVALGFLQDQAPNGGA